MTPTLLQPIATRDDARSQLLRAFELAELEGDPAWLRFAVVGGGETGVGLAGRLAALANRTLGRGEATISLVEAAPRILPYFPERRQRRAVHKLAKLGVDIWLRAMVVGGDSKGLDILSPGGVPVRLPAATVLWACSCPAPLKDLSNTPPTTRVTI